jgi:hypothetical protein
MPARRLTAWAISGQVSRVAGVTAVPRRCVPVDDRNVCVAEATRMDMLRFLP